MTKYILHGGASSKKTPNNKNFYKEILDGLKDSVAILCIYFANDKSKWETKFKQEQERFTSASPALDINFIMASDEIELLEKQIKEADIIFIRGGKDVVPLVGILKKIDKLKDVLKNKFVIGSSAGVYALSKYYIRGNGEIFEGLGVLNIKSICHFSEDRSDLVEKLLNYKEDLELIKIPEEEIVLIEQ